MTRTAATTRIAVEVLVEEKQVAPMWIVGVAHVGAVAWTLSIPIWNAQARQTVREFFGDLCKSSCLPRTCWVFDLKVIAVKVVVSLESFDQQVIQRKPNWSAPIRVATEKTHRGLAGLIVDAKLSISSCRDEGM